MGLISELAKVSGKLLGREAKKFGAKAVVKESGEAATKLLSQGVEDSQKAIMKALQEAVEKNGGKALEKDAAQKIISETVEKNAKEFMAKNADTVVGKGASEEALKSAEHAFASKSASKFVTGMKTRDKLLLGGTAVATANALNPNKKSLPESMANAAKTTAKTTMDVAKFGTMGAVAFLAVSTLLGDGEKAWEMLKSIPGVGKIISDIDAKYGKPSFLSADPLGMRHDKQTGTTMYAGHENNPNYSPTYSQKTQESAPELMVSASKQLEQSGAQMDL